MGRVSQFKDSVPLPPCVFCGCFFHSSFYCQAFPTDSIVQQKGCVALHYSIHSASDRDAAGAAGAIDAVVAALVSHATDVAVQQWGAIALFDLCLNHPTNVTRAIAAGAVPALQVRDWRGGG